MAAYVIDRSAATKSERGNRQHRGRSLASGEGARSHLRSSLIGLCGARRDDAFSLDVCEVKGSYTPVGIERRLGKCRMSDPIHNFLHNLLSPELRRLV